MKKFTFKLDNRMKLVAEKISPRINLFTVKGKNDYVFRLNSKKTKELVRVFTDVSTYGFEDLRCDLTKSEHNEGGVLYFSDLQNGEYHLVVYCNTKKILDTKFNKKFLKKLYKTMKEVYEIE